MTVQNAQKRALPYDQLYSLGQCAGWQGFASLAQSHSGHCSCSLNLTH
jgi:hypothetical protein